MFPNIQIELCIYLLMGDTHKLVFKLNHAMTQVDDNRKNDILMNLAVSIHLEIALR